MFATNDLNSHGLWGRTAAEAPSTEPLDRDIRVDFAVIGAGYTGLSTALHLAEGGAQSIAVLESLDIGFGASGRNAGMVNAGAWITPDEVLERLGPDYGKRLLNILGAGPELVFDIIRRYQIACDAQQNGNLHCAIGVKGLANIRDRARQWGNLGVKVELLSAEETEDYVGSDAYLGALLDPRTGTIQPLSYVRGLAHAAIQHGVKIYTKSGVAQVRQNGGNWQLKTTQGYTVTARKVAVATNTKQIMGPDAWPQLQSDLVRMPYFNVATEPLPSSALNKILPNGRGAWDTATILSSFRLDASGRLIYGSVGAVGSHELDTHAQWARRSIAKLFPELRDIGIQYQWHGWIDSTAHHLPYLHELAPDVWAFSGYNGRGIGPGTILGRELAQLLLDKKRPQDMSLPITDIQPIGFKTLRETFYEKGAVLAHALHNRF